MAAGPLLVWGASPGPIVQAERPGEERKRAAPTQLRPPRGGSTIPPRRDGGGRESLGTPGVEHVCARGKGNGPVRFLLWALLVGAAGPLLAGGAGPGGGKGAGAGVRKKVIEFGWDEPDTAFLRKHIARMERTPFD